MTPPTERLAYFCFTPSPAHIEISPAPYLMFAPRSQQQPLSIIFCEFSSIQSTFLLRLQICSAHVIRSPRKQWATYLWDAIGEGGVGWKSSHQADLHRLPFRVLKGCLNYFPALCALSSRSSTKILFDFRLFSTSDISTRYYVSHVCNSNVVHSVLFANPGATTFICLLK